MSFTERAGLFPVLLLTGCVQPAVYTGPPSGNVVDSILSRSAANISAMQYRVHQTGPSAQRPASPATKTVQPLMLGTSNTYALKVKPASTPTVSSSAAGQADGFVWQAGAAPTLRAALRKIVPPGQTVVFDRAVSADAPALWRWTGNDRWQFVSEKMLAARGLKATFNTKEHTMKVEPAQRAQTVHDVTSFSPAVLPGSPVKQMAASTVNARSMSVTRRNPFRGDKNIVLASTVKSMGISGPPVDFPATSATTPTIVQLRHWHIETGNTVKDWLYSQASSEICNVPGIKNWTIAWLTPTNYRVDAPLNFDGSFREMLNRLFTLYGTAKVPLYAGYRASQCVVSVDDREVQ